MRFMEVASELAVDLQQRRGWGMRRQRCGWGCGGDGVGDYGICRAMLEGAVWMKGWGDGTGRRRG